MSEAKQDTLEFGAEALPEAMDIDLRALPADEELLGPAPTPAFLRSVRVFGVLQPIIVMADAELRDVRLLAGRRRVKAARAAGLATIPALRYEPGVINPEVVAVIENAHRSPNDAATLAMIEALVSQGHALPQICVAVGMTKAEVGKILGLKRLRPELRTALDGGRMSLSTAYAVSKLSASSQAALAEDADDGPRITARMVDEVRQVGRRAVMESFGQELAALSAERPVLPARRPLAELVRNIAIGLPEDAPDEVRRAVAVLQAYVAG